MSDHNTFTHHFLVGHSLNITDCVVTPLQIYIVSLEVHCVRESETGRSRTFARCGGQFATVKRASRRRRKGGRQRRGSGEEGGEEGGKGRGKGEGRSGGEGGRGEAEGKEGGGALRSRDKRDRDAEAGISALFFISTTLAPCTRIKTCPEKFQEDVLNMSLEVSVRGSFACVDPLPNVEHNLLRVENCKTDFFPIVCPFPLFRGGRGTAENANVFCGESLNGTQAKITRFKYFQSSIGRANGF